MFLCLFIYYTVYLSFIQCDLKVSSSPTKIDENFPNYFLKTKANSKCFIVLKCEHLKGLHCTATKHYRVRAGKINAQGILSGPEAEFKEFEFIKFGHWFINFTFIFEDHCNICRVWPSRDIREEWNNPKNNAWSRNWQFSDKESMKYLWWI